MVGPRPRRQDFYVSGLTGRGRIFRQEAYENAVGNWERQRDEEREASGWRHGGAVDGEPAKVKEEDGRVEALWGGEGESDGHRHGHIVSNDGVNAAYVRYPGEDKSNPTFHNPDDKRRRH
jgi:hypothetical protein